MEYCERLGNDFWAEPVNALTNAGFVIAAILLFRLLRQQQAKTTPWDIYVLVFLLACVGIGSFLWHTFAAPWAALADKLPIFAFMFLYLFSYMARVLQMPWFWSLSCLGMFIFLNVVVKQWLPADLLNGSIMYLPALFALLLLGLVSIYRRLPGAKIMLGVTGLFCVSVLFRSVDQLVCESFPLGTHFVWHLLNALMLYWLMTVLSQSTQIAKY